MPIHSNFETSSVYIIFKEIAFRLFYLAYGDHQEIIKVVRVQAPAPPQQVKIIKLIEHAPSPPIVKVVKVVEHAPAPPPIVKIVKVQAAPAWPSDSSGWNGWD